ncbi:hypothetical protein K431DRAFT_299372 [Polychaeton citri CBS 116435]|uniref:Uncharacterized protein n=1 Tax=Polychaeton citri CBS 116435 TaxID=1314669 RepID=A0A9P4UV07_9PEZI|nr:hypothetical protein K431DRAFT_299372 [Polychaeton citri CBS 116435]
MSDLTTDNAVKFRSTSTSEVLKDATADSIKMPTLFVDEEDNDEDAAANSRPRCRIHESSGSEAATVCFQDSHKFHIYHHHLKCGHDIVTGKPEACGSNCKLATMNSSKPPGGRFECPARNCARHAAKRNRVFVNWGLKAKHGRFCVLSHVYSRDEQADEERRKEKAEAAELKRDMAKGMARHRAYCTGNRSRGFFGPDKRSESPTSDEESRKTFRYRSPPSNRHRVTHFVARASSPDLPPSRSTAPSSAAFAAYRSPEDPEMGVELKRYDSTQSQDSSMKQENQDDVQEIKEEQVSPPVTPRTAILYRELFEDPSPPSP